MVPYVTITNNSKCFDYYHITVMILLKMKRSFAYSDIRGLLNKFPDFFRMGTFIDSTRMKL